MAEPEQIVYTTEAAIPGYQQAWVWGSAALAILLCGAVAGWLFKNSSAPTMSNTANSATLLAEQEAVNAQLREHIAQLEAALAGDVCSSAARKALAASSESESP